MNKVYDDDDDNDDSELDTERIHPRTGFDWVQKIDSVKISMSSIRSGIGHHFQCVPLPMLTWVRLGVTPTLQVADTGNGKTENGTLQHL